MLLGKRGFCHVSCSGRLRGGAGVNAGLMAGEDVQDVREAPPRDVEVDGPAAISNRVVWCMRSSYSFYSRVGRIGAPQVFQCPYIQSAVRISRFMIGLVIVCVLCLPWGVPPHARGEGASLALR